MPFGATVTDAKGKNVGVVGQGGKIFARGLADHGELNVRWAAVDAPSVCKLSYSLPVRERSAKSPLQRLDRPCVAASDAGFAPNVSGRGVAPDV